MEKFDAILATGMFSKGHVGPEGTEDMLCALKNGGYAIFSVRDDYYESEGYFDKFNKLEEEGVWKFVKSTPYDNYVNNEGHKFLYPSKNKIYVY